jgi:hypothetical protein
VSAACRIVERRILADHIQAAMRGAAPVVPQRHTRPAGPMTPPPGMRRAAGLPVQVPELTQTQTPPSPVRRGHATPKPAVPHAVTAPIVHVGGLHRRTIGH